MGLSISTIRLFTAADTTNPCELLPPLHWPKPGSGSLFLSFRLGAPSVSKLQSWIFDLYFHMHFRYCLIWHNHHAWPVTYCMCVHVCTNCFRMRLAYSLAHITCYSILPLMCTREISYDTEPKLHNKLSLFFKILSVKYV